MPIFARRGAAMPVALHGPPPSLSVGAQASARPEAVVATAVVAATERTTHASNRATADTADEDSSRTRSGPPLFASKGSIRPSGDGCEAAGRGAKRDGRLGLELPRALQEERLDRAQPRGLRSRERRRSEAPDPGSRVLLLDRGRCRDRRLAPIAGAQCDDSARGRQADGDPVCLRGRCGLNRS